MSAFFHHALVKTLGKSAIFFLTLALAAYALDYAWTEGLFDTSFARLHLLNKGLSGASLFFILAALFSAIGAPRQVLSTIAGFSFGTLWGIALANTAFICGSALAFFYARVLARNSLRKRFEKRIAHFEDFLLQKPFPMIVAIRLFPFGNNLVTNLLGGISRVSPAAFLSGTFVGYLPQTIIFSLLGSGIAVDATLQLVLSCTLFLISAVIGLLLFWHLRKGKPLDEEG